MIIHTDRLCATFMDLCATDSEPKRERLLADKLKERLAELGFAVLEDDAGENIGGTAGNLFARLPGTGEGEPVLFSCHMDRVTPGTGVTPRIEGGYIISDGTTVLGADDAAGLAAILEGVRSLRELNLPHPPIELVFTVAEELGLVGSPHFDLGQVSAPYAFILDASGPVGEIVVQAPEQVKLRAVFHGKKAHAGFAPEEGISAIQMAAAAVGRMKLLRIDPETTANVGSITASFPTNIVPDRCELEAEARSLTPDKLRAQADSMRQALERAAADYGGTVDITETACYQAYNLPEDAPAAIHAARAARRIGVSVRFKATGGGSDANIFNSKGLPSIVLSCGYEAVHTTGERMSLDQLALLARWVVALILENGRQGEELT